MTLKTGARLRDNVMVPSWSCSMLTALMLPLLRLLLVTGIFIFNLIVCNVLNVCQVCSMLWLILMRQQPTFLSSCKRRMAQDVSPSSLLIYPICFAPSLNIIWLSIQNIVPRAQGSLQQLWCWAYYECVEDFQSHSQKGIFTHFRKDSPLSQSGGSVNVSHFVITIVLYSLMKYSISREYDLNCITLDGDQVNRKGAMTGGFYDIRFSKLDSYKSIRKLETELKGAYLRHLYSVEV